MQQRAVREELAGRAPRIGEDHQGPDFVGIQVEHDGVGVAVALENDVVRVVPAVAPGEHSAGGPDVCAVQEDHGVVARHGRVHGGYACIGNQELPRAREVSMCELGNREREDED